MTTDAPNRVITIRSPRWTAELTLWGLLLEEEMANRRRWPLNLDLLECLHAEEVYAAEVDVEDTYAGRGMRPEPTYPPRPEQRVNDWHEEPRLLPWLSRHPVLVQLLDRGGVDALYRWAGVGGAEADAYGLHSVGLTPKAIGELLVPPRNERTVRELIGRAEDRIMHALDHVERLRYEEAM